MGQKDLRGKLLEDYEDVFSDIFNVLVFKDNVIKQQYLKASATESVYKSENKEYSKESILGLDYTEEEYTKAENKLLQAMQM